MYKEENFATKSVHKSTYFSKKIIFMSTHPYGHCHPLLDGIIQINLLLNRKIFRQHDPNEHCQLKLHKPTYYSTEKSN